MIFAVASMTSRAIAVYNNSMSALTDFYLTLDGKPWTEGLFVALPRHWTIGGLFVRRTPIGGRQRHPMGFPAGPWLDGDALRAGAYRDEFVVTGVKFPMQELRVASATYEAVHVVPSGFILGALLESEPFRVVYVVLYHRDGVMVPRIC